jgi:hypothetical protein
MKSFLKRLFSSILLFFFIVAQIFALPSKVIAGGLEAILRYAPKSVSRGITAFNVLEAAALGQGGVIFMSKAETGDIRLQNQPIALNYSGLRCDGSRLRISFGRETVRTNDLYDWMLLPIAMYVDSEFNNCVTLLAKPKDQLLDDGKTRETDREAFDKEKKGNEYVYWAEYHPAFINTLVGFNLFLVDAMLIAPDVSELRSITNSMGTLKGYNKEVVFDKNASDLSAEQFGLISTLSSLFGVGYHSYIFSEPDDGISFEIINNKIKFYGNPYYHFLKSTNERITDESLLARVENPANAFKWEPADVITDIILDDEDPNLIKNLNPAVFETASKTAYWAAFFRYVKDEYPRAWERFIRQIRSKAYHTPVEGSEFPEYHYKIKQEYIWKTPRCLDLLQTYFGEKIEEEYDEFVRSRRP